jgi:TolB-like protein/Flp pilus assembly protein TadD
MAVLYLVAAWLVAQVAEVVVSLAALPEWVGQLVLALLAVGFPIALVLSWFFELTPEGLSLDRDDASTATTAPASRRVFDVIVIALLSAAVLMFAWDKWWTSGPRDNSIAVLAFENMSGDPEQEYFSDGIAEQLLDALAQVPGLDVKSRTSSFLYKGANVDIPTVARQLGVAFVLEGSVRKTGDRVRITAQLIDAARDEHMWSQSYDRQLDDIFTVQDDISTAIVEALRPRLKLDDEVTSRTVTAVSPRAYEAYIRGRHLVTERSPRSVRAARRQFEEAIEIEPNYALAHAELAIATLLPGAIGSSETKAKAASHAERAMELDPGLAQAHAASGFVALARDEFEDALPHFERAVEINPTYADAYNWLSGTLRLLGRFREAGEILRETLKHDPLSKVAINNLTSNLILSNQLAEAHRQLEHIKDIYPALYADNKGVLAGVGGNWSNIVLGALRALQLDREYPFMSGMPRLFVMLGLDDEMKKTSQRLTTQAWMAYTAGDTAAAVAVAESFVADYPLDQLAKQDLGRALAADGRYEKAGPILEEFWQMYGGKIGDGAFWVDSAFALIAIRRDTGKDDADVLRAIDDHVQRLREGGATGSHWNYSPVFEDGVVAFLSGKRELGLTLIARAAEDGFFIVPNQAYLSEICDDPGFAPIRAGQLARQERERARLLAVVCNENPYADVWQPLASTCEAVN